MKTIANSLFLTVFMFMLSSCMTLGSNTGFGPQGSAFSSTIQGTSAYGPKGPVTGESCVHSVGIPFILWGIASWGDGSVEHAAKEESITNIYTVDKKGLNVAMFYSNLCSVITGDRLPLVDPANIEPASNKATVPASSTKGR